MTTWHGRYIVVWPDRRVEFFRCVACGKKLDSRRSRDRGYGDGCMNRYPVALLMVQAENARKLDRDRWVEDRDGRSRGAATVDREAAIERGRESFERWRRTRSSSPA